MEAGEGNESVEMFHEILMKRFMSARRRPITGRRIFCVFGHGRKTAPYKTSISTAAPRVFSCRRQPSPVSDGHAAALIRRAARAVRS